MILSAPSSFAAPLPQGYDDSVPPQNTIAEPKKESTKTPEAIEISLTERKLKAETDLKNLHIQLTSFTTRTQLAIDRLVVKDIDVMGAQNELSASIASLLEAKNNLDSLSLIQIIDDASESEVVELKNLLAKIEENLINARLSLINSLNELKVAVSISINAQ